MNFKSREKLLASVAALSLLGISPQQTFAAQITTNQAVQQTKKITGNVSDAMGPIIGATVKVKGTKNAAVTDCRGNLRRLCYQNFQSRRPKQVRHHFGRRRQQS